MVASTANWRGRREGGHLQKDLRKDTMKYRREIDGLRALALIPVILFHAGLQTFSGGFVGVDVFFVISGYLITTIILTEKDAGKFTLLNFYERRARRILPALFLMTFTCIPFGWYFLAPGDLKDLSESILSVNLFASNILFWRTSGYFDTAAELKPLLHTWSLAVEEQFYLLFPCFILLVWNQGKRCVVIILIIVFCASLTAAQWGSMHKPVAAFFLLPTRGFEILIGTFAAYHLYLNKKSRNVQIYLINEAFGLIGLFLILIAVFVFDKRTPTPSLFTLVPTVGTLFIILFANYKTLVGRILGSSTFVGVGLISYSAYLWHQPLLAFLRVNSGSDLNAILILPIFVTTLGIGFLSWRYIEIPFRKKNIISRKTFSYYIILCSTFLLIFGIFGSYTTGFVFRYKEDDRYLASINFSENGKYVGKRFNEILMKNFDAADDRRKILVVGDSFAQDLINSLYEAGFEKQNQFSTRYIVHGCGNLFISRNKFSDNIDKDCHKDVSGFGYEGLYEDQRFRNLMRSADEIWFASAWDYWQADLIKSSVINVNNFSGKPVKVFGRKGVGKVDIKDLLSKSQTERLLLNSMVDEKTLKTNQLLKKNLSFDIYVDLQDSLCGVNTGYCTLFDAEGGLISYDGHHLTPLGARHLGGKLAGGSLSEYVTKK